MDLLIFTSISFITFKLWPYHKFIYACCCAFRNKMPDICQNGNLCICLIPNYIEIIIHCQFAVPIPFLGIHNVVLSLICSYLGGQVLHLL